MPRSQSLRTLIALAGSCAALFALVACGGREPCDLLIHNATVVDLEAGKAIAGRAVLVRAGRIWRVVPEREASSYEAATAVDARGGFLLPALADAHVHLQYPSELDNYLIHGVGLVVNMSGRPMHPSLREDVRDGRRAGPRIVTVGPTLDGAPPTNPLFTSVTPETAPEVVGWIADAGYDAVKVYQQIDAATLSAVIGAAAARGMITMGHVSRLAGIAGTLDAGLRYVAHGEELAFEAFDETTRRFDRGRIPALADLAAGHGVTVTPMIDYLEQVPNQVSALEEYLASDAMSIVPAAMRRSFGARQGWFSNRDDPAAFSEQMADVAGFVSRLTAALHERRAPLLLGTDGGFGGAIPGYSVHRELQSLVRAGLSELEALRTATVNVGRLLEQIDGEREPWGLIEPGYAADLLLLRSNPLREISATLEIEGVGLAGSWHGREELSALGEKLRDRQARLSGPAAAFEAALVDGDVEAGRAAVASVPADLVGEALVSPDNCIFLGYRHYYGGRRPLAGELYELCAEMHPDEAPLWLHIARAREEDSDPDGAIEAYERALDANPWYEDPSAAIRRLRDSENR